MPIKKSSYKLPITIWMSNWTEWAGEENPKISDARTRGAAHTTHPNAAPLPHIPSSHLGKTIFTTTPLAVTVSPFLSCPGKAGRGIDQAALNCNEN